MLRAILLLVALGALLMVKGQEAQPSSSAASLTPLQLERLLVDAFLRTTEYSASFRDLTAEEKQSVELYDAAGKLIRRREIVSDFVVYQSRFDKGVAAEYRNVREVDKVPVPGREERVMKLFRKLANSSSVNQELELISDEASRYDLNYSIQGYTLKQGLPLQKEVRSSFSLELAGVEEIEGHETFIIKYTQRAQSPELKVELRIKSLPKESQSFYRGRLWLDARTGRIWRDERELVLAILKIKEPLVLIRQEFHYTQSRFDILVPKRITLCEAACRSFIFSARRSVPYLFVLHLPQSLSGNFILRASFSDGSGAPVITVLCGFVRVGPHLRRTVLLVVFLTHKNSPPFDSRLTATLRHLCRPNLSFFCPG
ncbi:MAG: hypothetical protein LC731_02345 [Acidobacteria bacterium]|nr:hypothetical protein [Acidobacteriota bacterium]